MTTLSVTHQLAQNGPALPGKAPGQSFGRHLKANKLRATAPARRRYRRPAPRGRPRTRLLRVLSRCFIQMVHSALCNRRADEQPHPCPPNTSRGRPGPKSRGVRSTTHTTVKLLAVCLQVLVQQTLAAPIADARVGVNSHLNTPEVKPLRLPFHPDRTNPNV